MKADNFILEKKAAELRRIAGYNQNDCIRFKSLLLKLNVLTVFKPLETNFSGMAVKIGSGEEPARFILVNSSQSLGKQHFTISHELYHLFVQEVFTSQVCKAGLYNKNSDKEEINADIFASYFLLPETGVKDLIPDNELRKKKISLSTLLKLEHYFSCSRSALLYRLKQLNIIDGTYYDTFKSDVKKGAALHGYDLSLYERGNDNDFIGDYGSLAKKLYDEEKISETHYFSLLSDLGIKIEEIDYFRDDKEEE
jgi:Zn-dependent peptidase ImmA (M78 family)